MKKHKKTKHYYMHTLNKQPASFEGDQVCYEMDVAILVDSLRKIKQQQRRSREFRTKQGWDIPNYDYVKVALPEQDEKT